MTLQLGHGCSAAALLDGKPVDTSMGFSPLEGLIMATRPGDLDAGVLLELGRRGEAWSTISHVLNREAGLKGLSGTSGDVRELLELEAHGHEGATLALAAFHHRILKYLGAYAAVLGGLDAIAIGGGIGENAPHRASANLPRARVARRRARLRRERRRGGCREPHHDRRGRAIAVDVVPVDEELLIAERVRDSLPVAAHADDSAARSAS